MTPFVQRALSGAAMVVFGLAVGTVGAVWFTNQPPVVIRDLHETDGLAVRGGRLELLIAADKRRECPTVTSRYLWRWVPDPGGGERPIPYIVSLQGPPVPVGDVGIGQRYVLSLALPSDIEPGDWFYRAKSMRDCGWFPAISSTVVRETPDVPVRIVTQEEGALRMPNIVLRPDMRP